MEGNAVKKGILLVLVVAVAAFFLHGCHSSGSPGKSGYPVGHDMHPSTDRDQRNEPHPLQGYS